MNTNINIKARISRQDSSEYKSFPKEMNRSNTNYLKIPPSSENKSRPSSQHSTGQYIANVSSPSN